MTRRPPGAAARRTRPGTAGPRARPRSPRRVAALLVALAGALAPVLLPGCGTVAGDLPAVADQRWEPLAPAPLGAADDPDATAAMPTGLVPPTDPLPGSASLPRGGSLERIHASGHLRVGVSRDTQLRGAWNPVTGRFEGFDVDLARRIAMALFGVSDENAADTVMRFVPVSYAERLPAVENGDVDIVVSTMTYTGSRARRVGLSAAYFTSYPRFLSRRAAAGAGASGTGATPGGAAPAGPGGADGPGIDSVRDLAGKRVCAPRATTSLNNLQNFHEQYGGFEIVGHLNELSDCLVAFQQGDVDVVAANDASLVGMLAQDSTAVLGNLPGGPPEYYSVAFRRGDAELAGFVNGVLEGIRRDREAWLALCRRWEVEEMPCDRAWPPQPQWVSPR